jgi:cell division protease FtsH
LELIDREVERIVGSSVGRAEEILHLNWTAVYETANALIEQETLSGVALDAVLSTVKETLLDLGEHHTPPPPERLPGEEGAQEEGE